MLDVSFNKLTQNHQLPKSAWSDLWFSQAKTSHSPRFVEVLLLMTNIETLLDFKTELCVLYLHLLSFEFLSIHLFLFCNYEGKKISFQKKNGEFY